MYRALNSYTDERAAIKNNNDHELMPPSLQKIKISIHVHQETRVSKFQVNYKKKP